MQKRGSNQHLISFSQKSAVISEHTPHLGLFRKQTDDEVRTPFIVRVLPLQWVEAENGSQSELFNFMRVNIDKLLGTVFLVVAYWEDQRRKILRSVFLPFIIHFTIANIYYTTMLMEGVPAELKVFNDLCVYFSGSPESCD